MTIPVTTRTGKGSPLTNSEMDANLNNLARNSSETVQGNIRIANQTEVDTGTADDLAVSPKNLAASTIISEIPTGTLAASGTQTFPNGLMIQWGSHTTAGSTDTSAVMCLAETINFNTAFGSAPYFFTATPTTLRGNSGAFGFTGGDAAVSLDSAGSITTTDVDVLVASDNPDANPWPMDVLWLAIGEAP